MDDIDLNAPLPPETDLAAILDGPLAELAALLHTYATVSAARRDLADLEGQADEAPAGSGGTVGEMRDRLAQVLDRYAAVGPLDALRATHLAVQQLDTTRYQAIRDARADGASWSTIGHALGMSKQAAQEWHNKRSVPMFQDTCTS